MNKYEQVERMINGEYMVTCERCGGEGYISRYKHVQQGICFKCRGKGYFVRRVKRVA